MTFPECPFFHTDCFAFKMIDCEEKCTALNNTYFTSDDCPFYKTTEQFKEGLNKYPWRMDDIAVKKISDKDIAGIDYDDLVEWYYKEHPQKIPEIHEILRDSAEVHRYIEIKKGAKLDRRNKNMR